jgi:vacuolar-type H+-ATPase subunit H
MESIIERVQAAENEAKAIISLAKEQAQKAETAAKEKAAKDFSAEKTALKNRAAVSERMARQAGESSYAQTVAAAAAQTQSTRDGAYTRFNAALEFTKQINAYIDAKV